MANRLSDEQLRESLKEYGEDVGPITPTTRSAWERRLTILRKTKSIISPHKTPLNALSSDDSELENSSSNTHRKKRTSVNRLDSSERLSPSNVFNKNSDGNIFKKPLSVNSSFTIPGKKSLLDGTYSRNQSPTNRKKNVSTFDIETSDSDFDTDSSFSLLKNHRRTRRKHGLSSLDSSEVSPPQVSRSPVSNHRRKSTSNSNQRNNLQSFSTSQERLRFHKGNAEEVCHSNGYLSNSMSNGELSEERVEQGSSTNYSHCISGLLLFGTAAFFIIIGFLYYSELQKTTQIAGKNYSKFCQGIKQEHCEDMLLISRELHQLLSSIAGNYDCATDTDTIKRNLTVQEARIAMENYFKDTPLKMDYIDYLFNKSVLLFNQNPELGVKVYSAFGNEDASQSIAAPSILDVSALEAAKGSKSVWCRIRLSFKWTIAKILLLLSIGFVIFLCYLFTKFWKKKKEAQDKIFYEMVEKVIDILQENSDESENEPFKAVVKVRDAIIPPKERKQKLWLWDKVVSFIEENESRISVEYRTINGEDFKVWKWQPTSENDGGKQGKVWQGQAFSNMNKGRNATSSPSPCLKIRNMFDSEVEYGRGWEVCIQDAILEKCEDNNGIRHIAFDTSANEGCVYMLCSSLVAAGKAFNDLHGWWFDGKLVTVKYLPLKRYLDRFPDAEHCTEPLRPSNNKRLSLSTPFFSSALERS